MWICVRSKDAQKQVARRSLKGARTLVKRQNELVQLPEVCKMHKTMVFGLLFFITFLAIIEGIGAMVTCSGRLINAPVNSYDDYLIVEYFLIFICFYQKQLMGKVDQIQILSTSLSLHGLTNENLLLEAK